MLPNFANFLSSNGITLSLLMGAVGLVVAVYLIKIVIQHSIGTELMIKVSTSIQDGAKAYLNRQVKTISLISLGVTLVLFLMSQAGKVHPSMPIGFLIGAVCSLAAGYIGMKIAVMANVRTTQAAVDDEHKALNVAFNGGAVIYTRNIPTAKLTKKM